MHVKVTFQNLEQSEAMQKSLIEAHPQDHTINLEKILPETQAIEVYMTVEKSLHRVIQDLIKKDRNLYAQVTVEMIDQLALQAAQQSVQ